MCNKQKEARRSWIWSALKESTRTKFEVYTRQSVCEQRATYELRDWNLNVLSGGHIFWGPEKHAALLMHSPQLLAHRQLALLQTPMGTLSMSDGAAKDFPPSDLAPDRGTAACRHCRRLQVLMLIQWTPILGCTLGYLLEKLLIFLLKSLHKTIFFSGPSALLIMNWDIDSNTDTCCFPGQKFLFVLVGNSPFGTPSLSHLDL